MSKKWNKDDLESTKELFRITKEQVTDLLNNEKYDPMQIASVLMVNVLSLYKSLMTEDEFNVFIDHVLTNHDRIVKGPEFEEVDMDDDDEITLH